MMVSGREKKSRTMMFAFMAALFASFLMIDVMIFNSGKELDPGFMTGKATQTVGSVSVCINKPPTISFSCSNAVIDTLYSCDIDALTDSDQNVILFDNSSFFDINPSTGMISFTPLSSHNGTSRINITAKDNSSCGNNVASAEFVLNVSGAVPIACGDNSCHQSEDCSSCATDCGSCVVSAIGARGSRGLTVIPGNTFSINVDAIKVHLIQGESLQQSFAITNIGEAQLSFTLNLLPAFSFITIDPKIFVLSKGESQDILSLFVIDDNLKPGVYVGELIVKVFPSKGRMIKKSIPVIVEVESSKMLKDVTVEFSSELYELFPGEELSGQVTISSRRSGIPIDAEIEYILKDLRNSVIIRETDHITLTDQASTLKKIRLPDQIAEGQYVFVVQIRVGEDIAVSSKVFRVSNKKERVIEEATIIAERSAQNNFIILVVAVSALAIAGAAVFFTHRRSLLRLENEQKQKIKEGIEAFAVEYKHDMDELRQALSVSSVHEAEQDVEAYLLKLEWYVEEVLGKGFHPDQVRTHLKAHGWSEAHIERALMNVKRKMMDKRVDDLKKMVK